MAESVHAYLALSGGLAVVWLILYAGRAGFRPQMLRVSLATMPLGLTEPLFVPAYWSPPTLFDLARRTGFDLESLLFSFAIGGIVFAAYDALSGTAPTGSMRAERHDPRHRYHLAAIVAAPAVFVHGDPGPAQALATRIEKELGWTVSVPAYRDRMAIE